MSHEVRHLVQRHLVGRHGEAPAIGIQARAEPHRREAGRCGARGHGHVDRQQVPVTLRSWRLGRLAHLGLATANVHNWNHHGMQRVAQATALQVGRARSENTAGPCSANSCTKRAIGISNASATARIPPDRRASDQIETPSERFSGPGFEVLQHFGDTHDAAGPRQPVHAGEHDRHADRPGGGVGGQQPRHPGDTGTDGRRPGSSVALKTREPRNQPLRLRVPHQRTDPVKVEEVVATVHGGHRGNEKRDTSRERVDQRLRSGLPEPSAEMTKPA